MKYNKNSFFYIEKGKIVACDTLSQAYFELDNEHFNKLLERSLDDSKDKPTDEIEKNLLSGGLLTDQNEDKVIPWEGDPISYYSHQGTRIFARYTPKLDEDEFCKDFSQLSCAVQEVPPKYLPEHINEIQLSEPDLTALKSTSIYNAAINRKTCRNFLKKPIDLSLLTSILYFCFGPVHGKVWEDFAEHNIPALGARRSSPSATGMQGCDAYLVVHNVNGLEPGIYLYSAEKHSLYQLKHRFEDESLIYAMNDQFWAKNLGAGIFIVNDMRRTWIKDKKARGYLAAYLEAGHVSQMVLLSATSLGLHTWITGTFRDDYVNEMLQLSDVPCFASFFIGLGYGDNSSIPKKFLENLAPQT